MPERTGIYSGNLFGNMLGSNFATGGDGPSGTIQVPMTATSFLTVTGRSATHAYTCQESSGNLIDQIGALNMVANGTPLYQQSVTNWVRKGVGFNEGLNQRFSLALGVGPDCTVTPVAMLVYTVVRTPASLRTLLIISDAGSNARSAVQISAGGLARTIAGNAAFNEGSIDYRDAAVHPILLTYDAAFLTTNRYSDAEKDNGTFGPGTIDSIKGIGALSGDNSFLGEVLAYWILEGANAQFTDAQAKIFLQSLGWVIPW